MDKSTDKTPSGAEEQNSPKLQQKREISAATINAINTVGDEPGESKTFIGDTKESYDNRYIGDTPEDIDGREIEDTENNEKDKAQHDLDFYTECYVDVHANFVEYVKKHPQEYNTKNSMYKRELKWYAHEASAFRDMMYIAGYKAQKVLGVGVNPFWNTFLQKVVDVSVVG